MTPSGELPVRGILFDAGGTLIHLDGQRICLAAGTPFSENGFADAEAGAMAEMRTWILSHPESRDAERLPLFLEAILRRIGMEEAGGRSAAVAAIAAEHRRANLWSCPGSGALETLAALSSRGYRLGVVSNADGRVRQLLEEAGLAGELDVIVDSAEAGVEKPDPRIFRLGTERLGLAPERCAYVGDIYEIDVAGARAAGLHPILIGRGPAPDDVARVDRLPDLLSILPGAGYNP